MNASLQGIRRAARRGERGSAYIIALLVLLALTVIGLSLALTTGSEIDIGANERTANRVFYAADAGIGEATTHLIFSNDNQPRTYTLLDPLDPLKATTGVRVEVTPFHAINDAPSNLSEINQGSEFLKITYAVNALATRFARGSTDVVLAQKRLGVMLDIDPQQPSTDLLRYIGSTELDNIKF